MGTEEERNKAKISLMCSIAPMIIEVALTENSTSKQGQHSAIHDIKSWAGNTALDIRITRD